jgi:uncharacterized membrane protein YfcA
VLWTYIILAVIALLTSALSAVVGVGGGILMLAAIFSFFPHAEAIPTHAAVQVASNAMRVTVFFRQVDWSAIGRFVVGVLPGAAIGTLCLWRFGEVEASEPYLKIVVGVYVLIATYLPKPVRSEKPQGGAPFVVIGFIAGVAALTLGAIGPVIAPVIARADYDKERLIATQATCQMISHLVKFPAFAFILGDRLDLQKLGLLAVVLMLMTVPGTLLGKRLLHRIKPRHFTIAFRAALTFAAAKLIAVDGVWVLMKM